MRLRAAMILQFDVASLRRWLPLGFPPLASCDTGEDEEGEVDDPGFDC